MKTGKKLLAFLMCILIIFSATGVVFAQEEVITQEETIPRDEISQEDVVSQESEEIEKRGEEQPESIEDVQNILKTDVDSDEPQDSNVESCGQIETKESTSEDAESVSDKVKDIDRDSIKLRSFSAVEKLKASEDHETYGGKTISVSKNWKGDDTTTGDRPGEVTFELYASNSQTPVKTLSLTPDDATILGGSTWKGTFDGKYPIYDKNGEKITYTIREASVTVKDASGKDAVYKLDENQTVTYPTEYDKKGNVTKTATYRAVQDSDNTTTSEGYENISVFVPVTSIEEGEDYLVASGNSGNVNLYRAEAYQTDSMAATTDGDVSVVVNGRIISGLNKDGTTTEYSNYILVADEESGAAVGEEGKYLSDYMTWRMQYVENNTGILASNFYRLCGLMESADANKYPGYMSTFQDKGYGLCVYKKAITSLAEAPSDTQFTYDSATGGFKTPGSDKTVYLYKKIVLAKGTLENQTQTVGVTNWKNSSTSSDKDPLDTEDQSDPEPYTNISVSKVWADGNDHTGETVTVSLLANGVEEKELTISADTDWKGIFESLPTKDSDGNDITYTIAEKSVKDTAGNVISYISTVTDTTDIENEKTKVWLPVDRPSKKDGGEDYIVIAFPTTKSEIGQNIWGDGSATRKALTSNSAGTRFAMGDKNSGNTGGASMDVVVTEGPITVGGKTYTNYITDDQAHNSDGSLRTTIMWRVGYVGTASAAVASHADYGPWPRDLFYFKALAGKGGYLSTQGSMTLETSIDTTKYENNRSLFAYGMMYSSDWGEFKSMTKQGYTEDQITHMIGAMDHYALRSDKSPGKFGESDCTYPAMYLYKGVEVTNKSYMITNTAKKTITAQKIWDDNNNKDNKRVAKISVELFRNGVSTGKIRYLSEDTGWRATFDQLDSADVAGNSYTYSVKEHVSNQDLYDTTYETETSENGDLTIKITNTLKNEPVAIVMPETGSISKMMIQLIAIGLLLAGTLLMINKRKI